MNQINITGNLTKDLELRFIPNSGTAVARFGVAVKRNYSKEGQKDTDFFNVVVFGKQAENAANYIEKGSKVLITGELQNNHYEDKQGVKHYSEQILASRIEFLTFKNKNDQPQQNQQSNNDFNGFQEIDSSEDIPF